MKKITSLILSIIISISLVSSISINVNAVGSYGVDLGRECYIPNNSPLNPYSKPQCTWYCWGRAYEKLGVSLPSGNAMWGHANTWDESADKSSQFTVGTEARENSILVENNPYPDYGHVAFVEKVENGYAYISEGNYLGTEYHQDRINLSTMIRDSWQNHVLSPVRYIYLKCKDHKWDSGKITTKPTCKKDGVKTYTCTVCNEKKTETIKHSSKYHSYKVKAVVKATLHTNGKLSKKCEYCGKTVKSTLYRPKTIKLKKTKFVYNGKKKTPKVIVKNTKGKAIPVKYYKVTYLYNKNVGKAKAKIVFKTHYSGTVSRYFAIIPKGTSLSKLEAGSKSFTAKWKKQTTQTTGYQLQYANNSKFAKGKKTVAIKSAKTVSKKIKKLKTSTTYYVRVRTYKEVKTFKYFSSWSKAESVKTKIKTKPYVLIELKDGKNYKYDITSDGIKETIKVKTIKEYGKDNYFETLRYIYINGKLKIKATAYKGVNLWILTNKNNGFIIEQGVAGTGGTTAYYYYYNGKKYISKSLRINNKNESFGYYFEEPKISNGDFIVTYAPKYVWYTYVDSLMSFKNGWSFDVEQKYIISGGKLKKYSKYPYLSGKTVYISDSDFDTGKTITSVNNGDGVKVKTGDIVKIISVYVKDGYYYKIKTGNKTGWFKGSETIRLIEKE